MKVQLASVVACALLAPVFAAIATACADAGPIKHWGTFLGREVRALSFGGSGLAGEPRFTAVQGRDGYVYIRGPFGMYRVLDDTGRNEQVADNAGCTGWYKLTDVDLRSANPRAICNSPGEIIVTTLTYLRHWPVPEPSWIGGVDETNRDTGSLTNVLTADDGGFWFAYGPARGIGRVWTSGRAELRHYPGVGAITSVAAAGDDLYFVDDECVFGRLHGLTLIASHAVPCDHGDASGVATTDGAVWVLGGATGVVARYGRDGSHRSWRLALDATGVAVSRDGTVYVLGYQPTATWKSHPMIAVIAPGHKPDLRILPTLDVGSIAIDARDRLWISAPHAHGATVVAPKGAWN